MTPTELEDLVRDATHDTIRAGLELGYDTEERESYLSRELPAVVAGRLGDAIDSDIAYRAATEYLNTYHDVLDDVRTAINRLVAELEPRAGRYDLGAVRLVIEVRRLIHRGTIDARSPAGDACLDLAQQIDPEWDVPLDGDALELARRKALGR